MINSVFIMGLRVTTLAVKFALTFFITHYIGLAALGLYGLVVGASSLAPAILGLGMNGIVNRHIVDMPLEEALPHMVTRMAFNVLAYAALIPCFMVASAQHWIPVTPMQMLLISFVVFFEHMGIDIHGQLIARHRIQLANILLFVRGGSWVLPYIAIGWLVPAARTIDVLFLFWMGSALILWGILAGYLIRRHRWRHASIDWSWLRQSVARGRPFFLFDLGTVGGQYLDRFIISLFLGLEMTGVYTFFWSVTNAISSLVYYGVIQMHAPKMIGAHKRRDNSEFRRLSRRLQQEVWGISLTMSVALWALFPFLVAYLHRPLLDANVWAFLVMLLATLVRLGADALNAVLYAMSLDRAMATIALAGIAGSAVFNLAGAWQWGFHGVVWAYLASALLVLFLRLCYVRPIAHAKGLGA